MIDTPQPRKKTRPKVPVRAVNPAVDFGKPIYAVWEITLKCDQACNHCGSRAVKARPDELTTAEMLDIADRLVRMGSREVTLIGGEAYLRDDCAELVAFLSERGVRVTMQTGGRGLTLERIRALKQAGMKAIGVSADAAALYLQMLTLLWPTPKNIQLWNGWTAAVYKKAAAELVAKKLILEAKRERAQRSYFLPGGWEALKAPHPPMETWKVPLYADDRTETGDPKPRFQRFYAFDAPHILFDMAWSRFADGDPPRYEEVKR